MQRCVDMSFYTEQSGYEKTSLSELQGAWDNFKCNLLTLHPFDESNRLLFHTYEAISWEIVRDLLKMKDLYLLIRNIASKSEMAESFKEDLDAIKDCLDDAIEEYGK